MRFTSIFQSQSSAAPGAAPSRRRSPALGLMGLLSIACQDAPIDVGEPDSLSQESPVELPPGAVIDLGIEATPTHPTEGFSLPERVGSRLASWSEGDVSTVSFDMQGGAKDYLLAFIAEPYHVLGDFSVGIVMNKRPLVETTLASGWRAYRVVVAGDRIAKGRNVLSFRYAKTRRPSDVDPGSNDIRDLSVRFDQIQVQPISERAELAFGSKNALALAELGEGWARDPSDRGTGTWTVAERALITFHLARSEASPPAYSLALTARAPRGVAQRSVRLTLNGVPLGPLTFGDQRTTAVVDLPAERLTYENELALEFARLEPPSTLDPSSKDTRLLGLRVFELTVAPKTLASK
jgi:hypothetical protein